MSTQTKSIDEYLNDYDAAIQEARGWDFHPSIVSELERNRQKLIHLRSLVKDKKQEKRLLFDIRKHIEALVDRTQKGEELPTYGALREIRDAAYYAEKYIAD